MNPKIDNLDFFARTSELSVGNASFSNREMKLLYDSLKDVFSAELPDESMDEKPLTYFLKNGETNISKEISLSFDEDSIKLTWSKETEDNDALKIIDKMCKVCEKEIPNLVKLLNYIDSKYYFDFKTAKNHYELIHDIFFSQSPFSKIVTKDRFNLDNDLNYSIQIDKDRLLVINVTGSHKKTQIVKKNLKEERFRIIFGIAQMQNFKSSSLFSLFDTHITKANDFVEKELIPNVVMTISKEISK